jgi:hypothetical protein
VGTLQVKLDALHTRPNWEHFTHALPPRPQKSFVLLSGALKHCPLEQQPLGHEVALHEVLATQLKVLESQR